MNCEGCSEPVSRFADTPHCSKWRIGVQVNVVRIGPQNRQSTWQRYEWPFVITVSARSRFSTVRAGQVDTRQLWRVVPVTIRRPMSTATMVPTARTNAAKVAASSSVCVPNVSESDSDHDVSR